MDYLNQNLAPEERAEDLLGRMGLEEKLAQLQCNFAERVGTEHSYPNGLGNVSCLVASMWEKKEDIVERIREVQTYLMAQSEHHIPAIFHVETATGTLMPGTTVFPIELAQAASWNPELEGRMAQIIGQQTRACGMSQGLAPVLDISRDPRMGRQGESFGEDPTLAAAMGVAYVRGVQKDHNIAACSKHFLGFMHSEGGIHGAKTMVGPRELRETYAKVFQAAIAKAELHSAMNSYSVIDGTPAAGNKEVLTDLLRGELGFNGFVVSDYGAVGQLHSLHRVAESMALAGELAMEAGMDCELPVVECYNSQLLERFRSGEADVEILNNAVRRVLTEKFRLGLFENPFPKTDAQIEAILSEPRAREVSREMARQSMVLLKNDGILPIAGKKKIAVIGWHGGTTRSLFGCYMNFARQECRLGAVSTMAGTEDAEKVEAAVNTNTYPGSAVLLEHPDTDKLARECYPGIKSLYEELRDRLPDCQVDYAYGYPFTGNDESHFAEALRLAQAADLVIVTLGGRYGWTTGCTTGEGIDAMNIGLPACQERFLEELAKLNKPTLGLHFDGRPISSDRADRTLGAILECWAPGVYGQAAAVDILLGEYDPSGRLPVSIAYHAGQVPVYYGHQRGSSYSQGESICFQTYVDGPHTPRYAFGYGLSYTSFALSALKTDKKDYAPTEAISVSVEVTNTGSRPGVETVQLYVTDEYASMARPNLELIGFAKVHLAPGEVKTVTFTVDPSQFAFLDKDMKWKIEKGAFTLKAGHASNDLPLEAIISVTDDRWIDGKTREFYAESAVK